MIDGDLFPAQPNPLPLRCSRARFRMKLPFLDELEYSEVEGYFVGLQRSMYHGFPYWSLLLRDETNVLSVLFPITSGLFVHLLRHLIDRKFSYVDLIVNRHEEDKRLIVLLDSVQVEPKELVLPPIKKYRVMKNGRKTERHDYTQRNAVIEKRIDEVNRYNPRAHRGVGV